ncbi:hypothetical protein TSAR_006196 [Trichomalopsis sarcophagae]|uniref:Uncharacterized protein n=1 Tax=Trichomalopsis sarcophagae TaxID=543379 RepID=A0A232FAD8_9HYME|nr:hypothetical protein TSAR_006196 [Trichomalopsis sarcophagae]
MVFKLMNKVNRLQRQNDALKRKLEGDIAVINKYFPIDTNEANKNKKIDVVENMLGKKDQEFFQNAVIFFKSKGGSDCRKLIFNCMIAAITNEVANQYSFTGRKAPRKSFKDLRLCTCLYPAITNEVANQYSFTGRKAPRKSFKDLRLCTCLYQAVKLAFPNADDNDIKEGISAWLDTANTRLKREASGKGPKRAPFQPIVIDETLNSGEESDP